MIGPIGATEIFLIVIILLIFIYHLWRIFRKAGFPGWYSIFMILYPAGTVVMILYLAFAKWPIHKAMVDKRTIDP